MSKRLQRKIVILFFLMIFMIFIPLLSVCGKKKNLNLKESCSEIKEENVSSNFFSVLDESNGEIIKIKDKDFVCGVVASEMPALYEDEALKAQAVASYTYFSRQRAKAKASNKNYDFTVNTEKQLNYIPKERMKTKWNSNFKKYYSKIKKCVDEVFPEVIEEENGDLILAAYHAISSGETEKCEDVFGGDLKYLTNVESPGDKLAKDYETTLEIKLDDFKNALKNQEKDLIFEGEPSSWVKTPQRTKGGMVKEINICSKNFKGTQIRQIFSLRSSDFDLNYNQEKNAFIFTVKGYGHGVGMSQTGAQYMAKNGSNYKQILSWYYPNTSISKLKNL